MIHIIRKVRNRFLFSQSSSKRLILFAGQGTQELKMLDNLLVIPEAKQQIIQYSDELNIDFVGITTNETLKDQLNKTQFTQPLIVLSQCLTMKYFWKNSQLQSNNNYGINKNDILIGHSIGEYSALVASGSISLNSSLKLVKKRGQMMTKYTKQPSGMLFIRFNDQKEQIVRSILNQQNAQIAVYNTYHNIIIAGDLQKLNRIRAKLRDAKITSIFLPVSAAFHCKQLEEMKLPFRQECQKLQIKQPQCQIYRNYDCQIYSSGQSIIEGLVEHLTNPVQFYQSILKVLKLYPSIDSIEIGHKQNLMKFIKEIKKANNLY